MIKLLDTTLRDGSYAVNFQFTEDDIVHVMCSMREAQVPLVEVAHGITLGPNYLEDTAFGVDETRTLALTREICPKGCGILLGSIVDPDPSYRHFAWDRIASLDFVRLTVAPPDFGSVLPTVREFTDRGIMVFLQAVKTSFYDSEALIQQLEPFLNLGLEAVYVVDTVGCMTPKDVRQYVTALLRSGHTHVGFHGHDNSSLAVINSLTAIEAGAAYVDGTLGGIGRSAGNAQLELLAALIERDVEKTGVSVERLFLESLHLWERYPKAARGRDPIEVYYATHYRETSSREVALSCATELDMSPFDFIKKLVTNTKDVWIADSDVRKLCEDVKGAL